MCSHFKKKFFFSLICDREKERCYSPPLVYYPKCLNGKGCVDRNSSWKFNAGFSYE